MKRFTLLWSIVLGLGLLMVGCGSGAPLGTEEPVSEEPATAESVVAIEEPVHEELIVEELRTEVTEGDYTIFENWGEDEIEVEVSVEELSGDTARTENFSRFSLFNEGGELVEFAERAGYLAAFFTVPSGGQITLLCAEGVRCAYGIKLTTIETIIDKWEASCGKEGSIYDHDIPQPWTLIVVVHDKCPATDSKLWIMSGSDQISKAFVVNDGVPKVWVTPIKGKRWIKLNCQGGAGKGCLVTIKLVKKKK